MAVGVKRTAILPIRNAVVVIVKVATIADSITISISLVCIRRELAVVLIVGHAVVVVVAVAAIADTVVI